MASSRNVPSELTSKLDVPEWRAQVSAQLKRGRDEFDLAEFEDLSVATSSRHSGGSTASRNKRRRRAPRHRAGEMELELVKRFSELEFLGTTQSYRALDKALRHAEPCSVFQRFVQENPGLFEDVDFQAFTMVEANSVVELNHLQRFSRQYPPLHERYEPAIMGAVQIVASLLDLQEKLPFPDKQDLEFVRWQGDKFPGMEYAWQGFRDRSSAAVAALHDAQEAWDVLLGGGEVTPHLNRIGGRGKMVRREKLDVEPDEVTAGRLIFMTSQRDLYLNGVVEQRLTEAMKPAIYPISVGKTWWHGGVEEFLGRFAGYEMYACFDAAKYDSSLPPWLIRLALVILRRQFTDGENSKYDAYWKFVEDGLIYAPVYLDNGMQFRRRGGSTSGHSFNTLMQSVCTLLVVYTCYLELVGVDNLEQVMDEVWSEALGDDQHTGARGGCAEYTIDDIAPVALAAFGVDWFGDKSFNTQRLTDDVEGDFQGTQYLGKYFRWFDEEVEGVRVMANLPYRPFVETCLRLYYPERGEQGERAAWQRAVGHFADAAGNTRTRLVLNSYLDWLEGRVEDVGFTWSDKWMRRFEKLGDSYQPPVPARRIDFGTWLAHVTTAAVVEP